jgi:hypothetical protein
MNVIQRVIIFFEFIRNLFRQEHKFFPKQ